MSEDPEVIKDRAKRMEGYMKLSRDLHDAARPFPEARNLARAVRSVRANDADLAALAEVAERSVDAAFAALVALARASRRRAAALAPPPGEHDNCLLSCGPGCEA